MDIKIRLLEFLRLASNYSVIVPMVLYLVKIKRAPLQNHVIGCALILSAVADVIGLILYSYSMSTVVLFNVFCILQFLITSWFYYEIIFSREFKKLFYATALIALLVAGINTFSGQGFHQYQTYSWAAFSVALIIFSIFHLKNVTRQNPYDLHLTSAMHFSIGIIIYFSFSFWLFLISEFIIDSSDRDSALVVWAFHNLNNITKNLIFAWAMFQTGKIFDTNK